MPTEKQEKSNTLIEMLVICAYCGKTIGEKEPLEDKKISHGCCKECYLKELEKINNSKKSPKNITNHES